MNKIGNKSFARSLHLNCSLCEFVCECVCAIFIFSMLSISYAKTNGKKLNEKKNQITKWSSGWLSR